MISALRTKRVVVLLDGIDEAAGLKEELEDWLHGTLVPRGIQIVVTSRPEGVRPEKYQKRFVLMNLRPLSTEQQVRVPCCVRLLINLCPLHATPPTPLPDACHPAANPRALTLF